MGWGDSGIKMKVSRLPAFAGCRDAGADAFETTAGLPNSLFPRALTAS
jgi:hypothetical protein